jgi:hypothetical protein
LLTAGQFTEIQVGRVSSEIDAVDVNASRLNLAVSWFPQLRR